LLLLGKNKGTAAGAKSLAIAFQDGVAAVFEFHGKTFGVDNYFHAGCETHQIVRVRQRIGFIEVIHSPAHAAFRIAPGAEAAHVKVPQRPTLSERVADRGIVPARVAPSGRRCCEKKEMGLHAFAGACSANRLRSRGCSGASNFRSFLSLR